jgi:hypothetical protein
MTNPIGAPTLYNNDLANEICDAIADTFKSIKTLCKENPKWPKPRTIRTWIRENKEFQHMYALAKDDQADLFVEEMLEIADDTSNDTLIKYSKDGEPYEVCNSEWINRSRLRVDTRKWVASKYKPKKYGDIKNADEKESNNEEIDKDRELLHKCKTE